jgi:hypothetical protein
MCLVTGRESAANVYNIIWKEKSFQAACFHPKSKKPTTGQLENSYPSTLVKFECAKLKIQNMGRKIVVGDHEWRYRLTSF